MNYRPSLLKRVRIEVAGITRNLLPPRWRSEKPVFSREQVASWALEQLGDRAAPAIPQLVACATNAADGTPRSRHVALTSITILKYTGPAGVPAILSLLTNENHSVRAYAILAAKESKDPLITAQIKKSTEDRDAAVRRMATNALQFIAIGNQSP
jgi:HEAT repeat protein